jgi:phosphatidate phosphatase APP1
MAKTKESEITNFLLVAREAEPNKDENSSRDEFFLKVIDEVFSKENIEVKTDLNNRQIIAMSKGEIFAQRYDCSIMRDLCEAIMIRSVSKDRKGRGEFTEISKSLNMPSEMEESLSLKQRLLGE